jgi:hypothetical protein
MTIEQLLKDGITAVLFMLYAVAVGAGYLCYLNRETNKPAFAVTGSGLVLVFASVTLLAWIIVAHVAF